MLDVPPERDDVLSDDVELSCALRFAEAIEDRQSSIPKTFSNPDERDIISRIILLHDTSPRDGWVVPQPHKPGRERSSPLSATQLLFWKKLLPWYSKR